MPLFDKFLNGIIVCLVIFLVFCLCMMAVENNNLSKAKALIGEESLIIGVKTPGRLDFWNATSKVGILNKTGKSFYIEIK